MPSSDPHALLVLSGRSPLVFHPLHREPLHVHPLRALLALGRTVTVLADPSDVGRVRDDLRRHRLTARVRAGEEWWDDLGREPGAGLVVHDAMCPLVGTDFLHDLVTRSAAQPATSYVACRTVTDTLKAVVDGRIQGTIDRGGVATVTAPVVIAPAALRERGEPPPVTDFPRLVGWLRDRGDVELVRAPSVARRIDDARSLRLLESLDEVGHRVRAVRSVAEDRP